MGNLKSKVSDLKKKSRNKKALKGQVHQRNSQEIQEMDQDANQPAISERRDQQLDFSLTSEEADQVIFEREVNHLCSNKFFPHLVWDIVLKKLPRTDIQNCTNASLYFRSILKSNNEKYVSLPIVFAQLAQRYSDTDFWDRSYVEKNLQCITWRRSPRLVLSHRMTGLWKCRLVCKHWNQIIEHLHEDKHAGHFDLKYQVQEAQNSCINQWAIQEFQFGGDEFRRRFEATHFGNGTSKNPFLGRSLLIKPDGWLNNEDFLSIANILQRYGQEIWHFTWTEPCRMEDYEENYHGLLFYPRLATLVHLMPNLKVLRIKFLPVEGDVLEILQAMDHAMTTIPFPKLANLTFLSTYNVPNPILNHILIKNQQIAQLEVRRNSYYGASEIFSVFYPNITILSLEFRSVEDFECFENYPARMKLSKVQLRWHKSAPFLRWSRIFNALKAKLSRNDCTEVLLDLPIPDNENSRKLVDVERHMYTLNFPKLEHVTIFEKLPDYYKFHSEIKKLQLLIQGEIEFVEGSLFVFLTSAALNHPNLVYRERLFTIKIRSEFLFIGNASLIEHQGLKTCHFEYQTRNTTAKSFSKAKLQSFSIEPSDDDAPIITQINN